LRDLIAGQDLRQKALLLLGGPVLDEQRTDHAQAEGGELRRVGANHLFAEDEAARDVPPGSAVLLGPVRCDPALAVQDLVPLRRFVLVEDAAVVRLPFHGGGHGLLQPLSHLLAECDLLRGKGHVHGGLRAGDSVEFPSYPRVR
jgi:hypothetical protein